MSQGGNSRRGLRLLLIGASGHVGRHVLDQALADPRVEAVAAPGRRPLLAHSKLTSPIINFDRLDDDAPWWKADAVICTLGTTIRTAGSKSQFRKVDHDYPLAIGKRAYAGGASAYVLNSAIGANSSSRFFYNAVKGELEDDLAQVGFPSLTYVRPSVIGGHRQEFRGGERLLVAVLQVAGPLLPMRWRVNPPEAIARELLSAALQPPPGKNIVPAERMTR